MPQHRDLPEPGGAEVVAEIASEPAHMVVLAEVERASGRIDERRILIAFRPALDDRHRADQHPAGPQDAVYLAQGGVGVHMLQYMVADHCIEAAGRQVDSLDV